MEGNEHYRIVGILPDHEERVADYCFSEIEPFIRQQVISALDIEELLWFSTYKVHSRKADAFMKGRCFIAGDAAHIHTPAGGQGMNTGIQDAYNLAWKLACTIRGEVNANVLETYDSERTANAKHLLQTTDRMFDIMAGVNRFWNVLRLAFLPLFFRLVANSKKVKKKIFPLISQTGIAYPESYLTIKSSLGKVKAGDRMHYFVFPDGRQIFSFLSEPLFKLLYFGTLKVVNPLSESVKFKMSFLVFDEAPPEIFGNTSEFYILIRPDNHISYIGKDPGKCREIMERISFPDK
jgi:hypothetical protein